MTKSTPNETPGWSIVANTQDRLGESAVWHPAEQAIYWVDWYGPVLHRMRLGREVESWTIPDTSNLGSLVLASKGRLILAVDAGLKIFDPSSGRLDHFTDPNARRAGVSYNDSKVDRSGRLWVGTFDVSENAPRGILYCVERSDRVTLADSGYTVCNGPAFSPDGRTLYFSDTVGKRIIAYDTSPETPQLTNRRTIVELPGDGGWPDGLTVDASGNLWCAHYGAGRIARYSPDGTETGKLDLPCANVTSCAFGGPSMSTLFVTTGWTTDVQHATQEPGEGGALFAIEVGLHGLAELEFDPDKD